MFAFANFYTAPLTALESRESTYPYVSNARTPLTHWCIFLPQYRKTGILKVYEALAEEATFVFFETAIK